MPVPRFRITERQVLMLLLITSCAAFGGAFLVVGFRRQRGERLEQVARARVHWMPPVSAPAAAALPAPYVLAEYFDPSLMSLPSAHGFSARMWQRNAEAPPRQFEPAPQLAWLDPPALTPNAVVLPTPAVEDAPVADAVKLPAALQELSELLPPEISEPRRQSMLRVEGALENRQILEQPNLPTPKVDAALRATRVRVAVTADGRVRYAVLERSCGNGSVDAQALELSRRLRFDAVSAADPLALTWGMLRFLWVTQ
jgi:hypothetical protein